jgi:hypothetical protein
MTIEQIAEVVTAVVAALGLLLAFIKPSSKDRKTRKLIKSQLIEEAFINIVTVLNVRVVIQEALAGLPSLDSTDPESSWIEAYRHLAKMKTDRFGFYMDSQKSFVYEIDSSRQLMGFYEKVETLKRGIAVKSADCDRQAQVAILDGRAFLREMHRDISVDLAPWRDLRNRLRSPSGKEFVEMVSNPPEE